MSKRLNGVTRPLSTAAPVDRVETTVACDVTNPLFGPNGASRVFGPQKGATPDQVTQLDDALRGLASRLGKTREAETPCAGAAGGLGFGMLAFFGATLKTGVDIVLDALRLEDRLRGADLCLTGEGRLDASSLHGKAPIGVARLCKRLGVPCVALVGSVGDGAEAALDEGLIAYRPIASPEVPGGERVRRAAELLEIAAKNAASSHL